MVKLNNIANLFWKTLYKNKVRSTMLPILLGILIILSVFTYRAITSHSTSYGPDPSVVMGWLLGDLAVLLAITILYIRRFFRLWFERKNAESGAKLQNRIVMMFCLVAAVPTLIISIFSSYFFNFGIQSWFDQKINNVIDKSTEVAKSYIEEHKREMKATALSMEDDLDKLYYKLSNNPQLFSTILDGQADMRSLNEAIVFQTGTNLVLAKASLSFSLSFTTIPGHFIERADNGEIVDISTDPTRIRMLIKLREYNNSYLLIGRLIDKGVIDQIDQTDGALDEYRKLRGR
ncbi:MAG: histidine kinase, partial [Rickettsiaceae bacterium]|nr:histidine kinase [Rickettsiaceae bacterium]